jgi:hypothetical protein
MGAAAAGEVALGDDRQLGGRQRGAHVQRGGHDVPTGFRQVARASSRADRQIEATVAQQAGEALGRPLAVGGHHDAVAVGEQLGEAGDEPAAVTDDRTPARGLHDGRLGRLGRGVDGPRRVPPGEDLVGRRVEPRERLVRVALPRRRQRLGEVVLLGQQVDGTVAHPPRLDEHDLGRLGQDVGEQLFAVSEPRQPALHAVEEEALPEPLPLLAAPRLGADELRRAGPHLVGRDQLAGGEDAGLSKFVDRALVAGAEAGEAVDLVAPQIDADRVVTRRREDVDDRPPAGELAAVLDELLAPVAELGEAGDELVGVDDVRRSHGDRLDRRGVRTQPLQQRSHAGDDHGGGALGILQPPQQLHALPHRLDGRADPLERQRLPRREHGDLTRRHELDQVVAQLCGHRAGRAGDDQRAPAGQRRQGGDGDRPGDLDHRQPRRRLAEGARQRRFVAQQRGEISQSHGPSRVPTQPGLRRRCL